jgi:hypothetical protein
MADGSIVARGVLEAPRRMQREIVYRRVRIVATKGQSGWQARPDCCLALSAEHPTPEAAIAEIKRYIDDVRSSPGAPPVGDLLLHSD